MCIAAGFLAIVVGADFVQRKTFSVAPVGAGLSYALLVANLLYGSHTTDEATGYQHHRAPDALQELIDGPEKIAEVVAIGPAIMMKRVAEVTRPHQIPTLVSLNTIMIDGTGMCGGCRVGVGGKTLFVCVDGPEFDGHAVDFDLMMRRQAMYQDAEKRSYEEYLATHRCRLEPHITAHTEAKRHE